jgi:hypothetical protein
VEARRDGGRGGVPRVSVLPYFRDLDATVSQQPSSARMGAVSIGVAKLAPLLRYRFRIHLAQKFCYSASGPSSLSGGASGQGASPSSSGRPASRR